MSWLTRRKNAARVAVLLTLTDGRWWYGLDLLRATRLRAGRLYPALQSLEDEGAIEACWAELEPGMQHRRRMYRMVDSGRPLTVRRLSSETTT